MTLAFYSVITYTSITRVRTSELYSISQFQSLIDSTIVKQNYLKELM